MGVPRPRPVLLVLHVVFNIGSSVQPNVLCFCTESANRLERTGWEHHHALQTENEPFSCTNNPRVRIRSIVRSHTELHTTPLAACCCCRSAQHSTTPTLQWLVDC
jgi:hypothetical protein